MPMFINRCLSHQWIMLLGFKEPCFTGGDIAEQSIPISLLWVVGAPTSPVKNTSVMTNNNKYNSSVEIGTATNSENTRQFIKKETLRKIKSIGGHVGLLIILMLYTAIGGLVRWRRYYLDITIEVYFLDNKTLYIKPIIIEIAPKSRMEKELIIKFKQFDQCN